MHVTHGGSEDELTVASKRTRRALVPSLISLALVLVIGVSNGTRSLSSTSLEVMAILGLSFSRSNGSG